MKISIKHQSPDTESYRAARVKSLFNCEDGHEFSLDIDIPIESQAWGVGLIVGPSGSGKTSIGKQILGKAAMYKSTGWPSDKPIIDAINPDGDFNEVTAALSSVGLGSVPAWMRPYKALSNGEKFRADLARVICGQPQKVVIDEFTSVIDRQIAKIGASAFSKAWRRTGGQCVLLSCHYDIIEWLQPDWVLDLATGLFDWRSERPRKRPEINVEIRQTNGSYWPYFEQHHYLKIPRMIAATYYVATVRGKPVAHVCFSTRPGLVEARAARFVVMPEWQGIGIGLKFLESVCRLWSEGHNRYGLELPTLINTSHPGLCAALRHRKGWTQISGHFHGASMQKRNPINVARVGGHFRATQGFRFLINEEE